MTRKYLSGGPKTPNSVAEQALGHGIADPHNLQLRNPFHGCSALSFVAWLEVGGRPHFQRGVESHGRWRMMEKF